MAYSIRNKWHRNPTHPHSHPSSMSRSTCPPLKNGLGEHTLSDGYRVWRSRSSSSFPPGMASPSIFDGPFCNFEPTVTHPPPPFPRRTKL